MTNRYADLRYDIDLNDKYPFDAGIEARILGSVPALLAERDALRSALHSLEVSANTVNFCYLKRPENFAISLTELKLDAEAARAALTQGEQQ